MNTGSLLSSAQGRGDPYCALPKDYLEEAGEANGKANDKANNKVSDKANGKAPIPLRPVLLPVDPHLPLTPTQGGEVTQAAVTNGEGNGKANGEGNGEGSGQDVDAKNAEETLCCKHGYVY